MAQQSKTVIGGLARHLVTNGLISKEDALAATEKAAKNSTPLVTQIVADKLISAFDLASNAANEFGQPFFDLDYFEYDPESSPAINEKLIKTHHALPIYKRANRLFIAISDPLNFNALDEFKFHAGANTEAVLVEDDKLTKLIEKVLESQDTSMDLGDDDDLEDLDISTGEEEDDAGAVSESEVNDAPVVKFVNKILLDAIKKGASDLHFEPYEKRYRIRFRTDGILQEIASPPIQLAGKLAARIKVMSQLDISERRVPQDGRIKLKISKNKSIDFRVSTCPTLFGEKTVMRILDSSSASLGIDMLGYEPDQKQIYLDNLAKPTGMILVTGPTGSGKTVSLYTGLNILNTDQVNISTAEDPVEINLEGINQVNVNPKVGLTFDAALKAFLRQDPDIIMVGEIRDITTAEIAVKAAQTGHMVMSTLHTNDAPQTLARLINIGVAPYNIANAVNLIIAQRLARRLCKNCKAVEDVPREAMIEEGFPEDKLDGLKIYKAVGCDQCNEGYKGRVGIYQVLPISEEMGKLIMQGGDAYDMAELAQSEGYNDLRQSAILKVIEGVTSLEEINRVTQD